MHIENLKELNYILIEFIPVVNEQKQINNALISYW